MDYTYYGLIFIFGLFLLMLVFVALGNFFGYKKAEMAGLSVTEGAIFGLMGLLIAFTFSNAAQRFDYRRNLMIHESNAISTAYLRTKTLKTQDTLLLKNDFFSYVSSEIGIYESFPNLNLVQLAVDKTEKKQNKLWLDAVHACQHSNQPSCNILILPAINTMFDISNERTAYFNMHPNILIFAILICVSLTVSFLTGYGIGKKGSWHFLHIVIYSMVITLTIYVIIDLEAPRFGMIKETGFDYLLKDIKNKIANSDNIQ